MEANIFVKKIDNKSTHNFILNYHYAHRIPSISYSFGLFVGGELVGICTFGQPGGACLSKGLFGGKFIDRILELNRLYVESNIKNITSFFVSNCIKQLHSPLCIVSFADTSMGHVGTIYKACNFIYTGVSAKRTEWTIMGMEHLHSKSIADKAKKGGERWERLKEQYGDKLTKRLRPSKHRYIYLKGTKKEKKEMLILLKYKINEYPKGKSDRYEIIKKDSPQQSCLKELFK